MKENTNSKMKLYLAAVYTISVCLFTYLGYNRFTIPHFSENLRLENVIVFMIIAVIAESIIIVYKDIAISTGFAVTTASTLLFGPFWGMAITAFGSAFRIVRYKGKVHHFFNAPLYKTFFNVSMLSITIFISYFSQYIIFSETRLWYPMDIFLRFTLAVVVFLLLNSFFVSILMAIIHNTSFLKAYTYHLRIGFINIVFAAPFGILLNQMYLYFKIPGALVTIAPIFLLRYILNLYIE